MTPGESCQRAWSTEAARPLVRRVLPRIVFCHVGGGAGNEVSLRQNEEALDRLALAAKPFESYTGTPLQAATLPRRTQNQPVVIGRPDLPVCLGLTGKRQWSALQRPRSQ